MKSENEIPEFLKLHQKIDCFSNGGEDSISSACMYTEMTLKNAKLYAPKFPIVTAPVVAPETVPNKSTQTLKTVIPKAAIVAAEQMSKSAKLMKESSSIMIAGGIQL